MCKRVIPLVMACSLAVANLAHAADPNLAGLWKLDDGSGTTAVDSTGKSGDGTLNGDPTWSEKGQIGGCLVFDGTNDYVVVNGSWQFPQYTLAAWFRIDGGAGTQRDLLSWCTAGQLHGVLIEIGTNETMRYLHRAPLANSGGPSIYSTATYSDGSWHHLAAVKSAEAMTLYMDGVQAATSSNTSQFDGPVTRLFMGVLGSGSSQVRWLPGALDDVRIYNRALGEGELAAAMKGTENTAIAASPSPADKATDVPRDSALGWRHGQYAKTHDVYFGTGYDDVNDASRANPLGVLASQGQDANAFDPAGLLAFGQTYYWRVDEVNAAPDSTVYKGRTWSFTAETYGYPVKPIKATASSSMSAAMGPDKTIDGSGLDASDQHSTVTSQMWLSKKGQSPVWIQYEFDKAYCLYQMWVWNSNQAIELSTGFGAKDVTIETSLDGTAWAAVAGVPEFAQGTGEPNYVHNTTVDFGGLQAKYVKLTIRTNWADGTKQASLSEVRFFYTPVKAFEPTPATGSTGVSIGVTLNWRPGRQAVRHEVYLGTDPNALTLAQTVTPHSLDLGPLGLQYGRTYYWRVNEVNDAANPASWQGDAWSFSTPSYAVVDDFEAYNDQCNRIFFAWADGYGYSASSDCGVAASTGNGTGSTVGNASAPFAERTIVHGGGQSMPLAYDNTSGRTYSEAVRTFDPAQDWTKGGEKTLVLYFSGTWDNGAGQLYVKINNTRVDYTGNAGAIASPMWRQWNVDLTGVGGLQAVKTLTIGVSGSGKGVLYIDDIRLYRIAPFLVVPADPGTANLAAYYPMEGNTNDSSGHGYNGTPMGNPSYVDSLPGHGKAIYLNGTDGHVDLPIGTLVSTLTSTTCAAWVNFSSTGAGWERVFDFGTGTTIYMFMTTRQGTAGTPRFAITTGSNTAESGVNSLVKLTTGWHHMAAVIDGTSMTMQFYLDGSMVGSGTTALVPKSLGKTTQNWLGRSQWSGDGYFNGAMDDFRIYDRSLKAGEVRYLAGDR